LPFHISADIRSTAIKYWLNAESRDEIASKLSISAGAVTNIINEWRINLGSFIIDDLRELSLSLKKASLSPSECAIGFRVTKMMQRFGITEEQFEYFMKETYNNCQFLDIGPIQIGKYLTEIVNLSNTIFPSQIPNYINIKKREREALKEQIENIQKTILELNNKKLKEEENLKLLIETSNVSKEAINWYKDIIKEIKNNGIPIDNAKLFIQCLKSIKNEGYDVNKVIMKYSESTYLSESIKIQKDTKQIVIQEIDNLENHKKFLEEKINSDLLKISKVQDLERKGFGLKELKSLYNTITEITKENNINSKQAIQQFFNQLNEYDKYIDLKTKIENLNNQLANLNIQISNKRTILSIQPALGEILQTLLRIGISEKDIADINSILLFGKFEFYKDNNGNVVINKESLIRELNEYQNMKLVIRSLEQKQIELKTHITNLDNQKILAENYINFLFSNLKEIQILLKKTNLCLDYPKIIFIYYNNSNNDNSRD